MKTLSIGKYRALQRASNENHIFTVLAIDHQDSLRRALLPDAPNNITDQQMVDIKQQVVSTLWHDVSGVLLDPVYGTAQIITKGLPASVGLLAELEKADYNMQPLPLAVEIRPNWNIGKIKRMGADGVKLFYYYDPDHLELCQQQDATIVQAVTECNHYDIPLYAEPIVTNATSNNRQRKVILSAQRTDELGADILKLEFPLDVHHQSDLSDWQLACDELTNAVHVPWVLLSAGVDFETFCLQVQVACQAGASGFIVGRAVWGDTCKIDNHTERSQWLQSVGRERIQRLNTIANTYATPWTQRYRPVDITTSWYVDYPDLT